MTQEGVQNRSSVLLEEFRSDPDAIKIIRRDHDLAQRRTRWSLTMILYDPQSMALFWLVWLIVQFVVFAFLAVLALLDIVWTYGITEICDNVTGILDDQILPTASDCNLNVANLILAGIACIVTACDMMHNVSFLIHKVRIGNEDDHDQPRQRPTLFCCSCLVPASFTRVAYCWILVHALLFTKAGSIYGWSWDTPGPDPLADTVMFFFTCLAYLLLAIGILWWQGWYVCCYWYNQPAPPPAAPHYKLLCIPVCTFLMVIFDSVTVVLMLALRFSLGYVSFGSLIVFPIVFVSWMVVVFCVGCLYIKFDNNGRSKVVN